MRQPTSKMEKSHRALDKLERAEWNGRAVPPTFPRQNVDTLLSVENGNPFLNMKSLIINFCQIKHFKHYDNKIKQIYSQVLGVCYLYLTFDKKITRQNFNC
jgi:hypothetical protein